MQGAIGVGESVRCATYDRRRGALDADRDCADIARLGE
jgi:hypothetical protein